MTNEENLAAARKALHDLLTGAGVAYVRDSDGSAISYQKSDIPRLRAYIAELQQAVSQETPRPLHVWF